MENPNPFHRKDFYCALGTRRRPEQIDRVGPRTHEAAAAMGPREDSFEADAGRERSLVLGRLADGCRGETHAQALADFGQRLARIEVDDALERADVVDLERLEHHRTAMRVPI